MTFGHGIEPVPYELMPNALATRPWVKPKNPRYGTRFEALGELIDWRFFKIKF
jgi:hypothetical protein